MPEPTQSGHWSGTGRLRGGRLGIGFFVGLIRLLGRRVAYFLVVVPTLYFTLFSPDVRATMAYHRRVLRDAPAWKRRWRVFRHYFSFARALIDRVAVLGRDSRGLTYRFDGETHLRDCVADGRGLLLLTAHYGNWLAAAQLLERLDAPVNVAGLANEAPEVQAILDTVSSPTFKSLPLSGDPTDAIALVAALRQGEVVAIMGDRVYGGPSQRVRFMGARARFPVGPYVLAALAGAPLVATFSIRESRGVYRLLAFEPERASLPDSARRDVYLREHAQRFASQLESVVRLDPFQWYNFFDFWEDGDSA